MTTQPQSEQRVGPFAYLLIYFLLPAVLIIGIGSLAAIQFGWVPPLLFGPGLDSAAPARTLPQAQPVNNPRGNPIVIPVQPQVVDLVPPTPAPPLPPNVDALANPALPARPVIDETQAKQLDQAAELAAQEAAQEYLNARQAQELAAPVKMDAQQVQETYGRDPCHVPRADPRTCGRGIVEATPLNEAQP